MAMNQEKTMAILNYLKGVKDANVTVHDIAAAIDTKWQSVNGSLNALVKRGLVVREKAKVATEDGKEKEVSFIKITADGEEFQPTAEETDAE